MKYVKLMSVLYMLSSSTSAFGMFDTLDFDEVVQKGGFNHSAMQRVIAIHPSSHQLTTLEQNDLLNSAHLINLRTLDLSGQPYVDDGFINTICSNPTFARIINLDLSNTAITKNSLTDIVNSQHLGSVRDMVQISGRYGVPSSAVYVNVNGRNIKRNIIDDYNTGTIYNSNFVINYKHPADNRQTYSPLLGIKTLEVRDY